jgi:hypothetical protein
VSFSSLPWRTFVMSSDLLSSLVGCGGAISCCLGPECLLVKAVVWSCWLLVSSKSSSCPEPCSAGSVLAGVKAAAGADACVFVFACCLAAGISTENLTVKSIQHVRAIQYAKYSPEMPAWLGCFAVSVLIPPSTDVLPKQRLHLNGAVIPKPGRMHSPQSTP